MPSRQSTGLRYAPRLVIMVKEPVAGRVKTRLARGIGTVRATAVYRDLVQATAQRLADDPRWQTILSVTPDAALQSRALPAFGARMAQGGGDIGARLETIFNSAPSGPVIVIGTDIPGIEPSDVARGFRALGRHDAVIGPSDDGGFWLIGLSAAMRRKVRLRNVRWSTAHARRDTEANLAACSLAALRARADIDTAQDHAALCHLLGRRVLSSRVQTS